MKRPLVVPDETRADQARAADPAGSVWVSANAGSGKTHVLAQRVIRLLLQGAEPSRILCLTYTRAAAANMSNRVFRTLSAWTAMPDETLASEILDLEGTPPGKARLAEARRLFARALDTPGGLKIQTIHAFCESVLHQFPLEANIAAHFELLDAKAEAALVADIRREMLTGAAGGDNPELAAAFATVLDHGGEHGLERLLSEIVSKRDGLRAFLDAVKVDGPPYRRLMEAFGFGAEETAETVAAAVWPPPGFPYEYFRAFEAAAVAAGAARVMDGVLPYASPAFAERDPLRRLALLQAGFLKADGGLYNPAWLFSKALLARLPDLPERFMEAAGAIAAAADRLALMRMLEATRAALDLADWIVGRYERTKSGRGLLDFNDLIQRTLRLLSRQDAGAWVQYRLDKGIDHILLDEAQDTSPDQWAVVKSLAEEFFAGSGAREAARTVFAVGDEKQSIYSFQGARPESFAETKHHFALRVRGAARRFSDVRLNWSFRSTADVLAAVDAVFRDDAARAGLTRDREPIEHRAIRGLAPGSVEVWPSIGKAQVEEPEDWAEPIDHASAPAIRLAEAVAATVERWIRSGEVIEGSGKRVSAGDILVLVRKRDSFMHALSRSLKNRDIPVAGADRLLLHAHIAVQDLAALGRVLLQPDDDLSLAAVLRSPIFDISEEALFALAWKREGKSLFAALRSRAQADPALAAIVGLMERWADEAAFKPPFEFYSAMLGRDGVRRRMIGRLGHEVAEILDEFLSFCLAEERTGLPGLEAFLATLERSGFEVKREQDQARDEVRIMTVHASKGLEAPIVFLVDSGGASVTAQHMPSLLPFELRQDGTFVGGYLWNPGADVANSAARAIQQGIKAAADEEYRRLLYVGMTRAEDRLIVCGYHGVRRPDAGSWLSLVWNALAAQPETAEVPHGEAGETRLRYRITPPAPSPEEEEQREEKVQEAPLPAGLLDRLPRDEKLPRPLSPSGASLLIEEAASTDDPVSGRSPVLDGDAPDLALARGSATHVLLQMLPGMAPGERAGAAAGYLARIGADWPPGERESALAAVMKILESPDFGMLFASGSRAEVSVMGTLAVHGRERAVSGTIDRLAVLEDGVQIVDYKTNRHPPATLAETPAAHVLQLALYAALLKPLYPGRRITAGLLYTQAPRLIAVPEDALAAALVRLTGA